MITVAAIAYQRLPRSNQLENAHEKGPIKLDIIEPEINNYPCWPWNHSTKECHFDWFFSFAFPFFIDTTKSIEQPSYDDNPETDIPNKCEEIIDDIDDNAGDLFRRYIALSEVIARYTTFTTFTLKYRPCKRIWREKDGNEDVY